jgi:hypothetical protein
MKRSSGPRKTTDLSKSVHQQLSMYALAAGAAGVSALALAQPAEARIIYTPAHKSLPHGYSYLDLNHDGINDFRFRLVVTGGSDGLLASGFANLLTVEPVGKGNKTWFSMTGSLECAYPVKQGSKIGPLARFGGGQHYMFLATIAGTMCRWNQRPTRAYLGLKFLIKGKVHYGWARFVTNSSAGTARLTGYAYETIPGKAIIAGATKGPDEVSLEGANATLTAPTHQPPSLGVLATGSRGLSIWRRKESALQGN